ncbi:MAG: protein kinase [Polyangiaceae bacterium]|nr:protein kinase [Polyangiaceae bacterium]
MAASVDQLRARAIAASPIAVGKVLGARFRVERIMGVGGMAYVYEAKRLADGARVAVKCLLPALSNDAVNVTRFLREAEATARVRSPHVVQIFETSTGTADGVPPYFVMEYLEGQDLGEVLEANGPFSVDLAVDAVLQACAGVSAAHALGIVHRDLKPSNLFRCGRTIKVVDFGIAKSLDAGGGALTETSETFGSPRYMSPEQVRATKGVDARTDVWSMGVVLYELLSGAVPFDGETAGAVLASIVADEPPSLRARAPHVPAALEAIVNRCLAKDRDRRLQSMAELRRLLMAAPRTTGTATERSPIARVLGIGIPLALAAGGAGYVAVLRCAPSAPRTVVVRPIIDATTTTLSSSAPVHVDTPLPTDRPTAVVQATRPPAGQPTAVPRFKPCTRDDQCGTLEKCYPGGCSCIAGAMRCGDACIKGNLSHDNCGCGAVCGMDEVCTDRGFSPYCEKCAEAQIACGNGCVNLTSDDANCGRCLAACAPGSRCVEGKCRVTAALGGHCAGEDDCGFNMVCEQGTCTCRGRLHPCNGVCFFAPCK